MIVRLRLLNLILIMSGLLIYPALQAQTLVLARQQSNPQPAAPETQKLKEVLTDLSRHYQVSILFEEKTVEGVVVPIDAWQRGGKLEKQLQTLLKPHGLAVKRLNEQAYYVVKVPAKANPASATLRPSEMLSPSTTGLSPTLISTRQPVQATTQPLLILVSGIVTDENGETLPGVSIVIKGSQKGTTADGNGRYRLEVPDASAILIFSFVGYLAQEAAVGNRTTMDVALKTDNKSLDEVVVIGYGTQRSQDLTGSVAMIDQRTIRSQPVASIDQKMIGQVAGVQIQQQSGTPGGGTSVKIRGMGSLGAGNEPLYVVDGMPYSAGMNQSLNPLLFINPNDIESISILKDASSTAIYGSRGANGVIMITTKKGKVDRTEISVSSMRGVQQVSQRGRPEMLSLREFAELQRDRINILVRQRENRTAIEADYPQEYRNPETITGQGTNWYGEMLQDAAIQDHSVSIQKGSKQSRISFSLGYYRQDGVLKYTGVERYTGKLSFDADLAKSVRVGATLQPSFVKQERAITNTSREDVLGVSLWANPFLSPYDASGNPVPYLVSPQSRFHSAWSFVNPVFQLRETIENRNTFQNLGSAFVEWEIIKNLRAKTSLSTIWGTNRNVQFIPATVGASNTPPIAGTGRSLNTQGEDFNWLIENTLTYNRTLGRHRFDALAGYTAQRSVTRNLNLTASPYANDLIESINAAQTISAWGQQVGAWSLISYLGRINYAYNDRYLLTTTFRSDGSSRFGSRNRFAFFPSVAVAWRISQESFLQNNPVINNLKLRASYGKSGNNNIGNYAHLATIIPGAYVFGNTQVTASSVGLANPYLTWEGSNQVDIGLDADLFKNRLSLNVDYYYRKTTDMLLDDVIPAITGFNVQTVNKGNVRNTGIELSLNATPISKGAFNWDANVNVAFNRNKVLSINENGTRILAGNINGNPTHVSIVGKPVGQFFGYIFEGLYTAADIANPNLKKTVQVYEGNAKYRDIDGDGLINDLLDYTVIGSPHPNFIFGITNRLSYHRLDLSLVMNGQQGGQVMNGLRMTVDNLQGFFNVSKEWVNRWRTPEIPGDGRHYGVPTTLPSVGHRVSSLWVEDASYLRITNLTLGYALPDSWLTKTGFVSNCRFYLTIQNPLTLTRYTGANPEAQAAGVNNTLAPGYDLTPYPLARTTSVGVNLNF